MQAIITGVDRLSRLVEERGQISLEDASKELEIGKKTVRDWADALAGVGRLEVKYGFNDIMISLPKAELRTMEHRPLQYERALNTITIKTESRLIEIKKLKDEFIDFNNQIKPELERAKKDLRQLELLSEIENEVSGFIKENMKIVKQDCSQYRSAITSHSNELNKVLKQGKNLPTKQLRKQISGIGKILREQKMLAKSALKQREKMIALFMEEQRKLEKQLITPKDISKSAIHTLSRKLQTFEKKKSNIALLLDILAKEETLFNQRRIAIAKQLGKSFIDDSTREELTLLKQQQENIATAELLLEDYLSQLNKTSLQKAKA